MIHSLFLLITFRLSLRLHVTMKMFLERIMCVDTQGLWTLVWAQCSRRILLTTFPFLLPIFSLCPVHQQSIVNLADPVGHSGDLASSSGCSPSCLWFWPSLLRGFYQPKISHHHLLPQLKRHLNQPICFHSWTPSPFILHPATDGDLLKL